MKPKRQRNPSLLKQVKVEPCLICGAKADPAHVRSRGAGGGDVTENVVPICRSHHQQQHARGWVRFCRMYPVVMYRLMELGWEIRCEFGVEKLMRRANDSQ